MLVKIAWKNIWRNRTRSLVVIFAIIIGVWAVIFLSGLSMGMGQSYVDNAIQNEISHLQIHHKTFPEDKDPKFTISNPGEVLELIETKQNIQSATIRTIANGMIASSRSVRGIEIKGIDPDTEDLVTQLSGKIVEGSYLDNESPNSILISTALAEKLRVGLRKKVTIRFQDTELNLVDGAFRVTGMFETDNTVFDESYVFVTRSQLNKLLNIGTAGHEIAILTDDLEKVEDVQSGLQASFPELLIQNYAELSPEIELFSSQINLTSSIFTFIVMLGLIFGIINTMLMAVLERYKEIGMLMAIGMNKLKVFFMIVLETLFLGLVGLPIGLLLGFGIIHWLSIKGLNLSAYSDAMNEFNMSEMVYPMINANMFIQLAVGVLITSILASIYPALKAMQLKPVDAIRKI